MIEKYNNLIDKCNLVVDALRLTYTTLQSCITDIDEVVTELRDHRDRSAWMDEEMKKFRQGFAYKPPQTDPNNSNLILCNDKVTLSTICLPQIPPSFPRLPGVQKQRVSWKLGYLKILKYLIELDISNKNIRYTFANLSELCDEINTKYHRGIKPSKLIPYLDNLHALGLIFLTSTDKKLITQDGRKLEKVASFKITTAGQSLYDAYFPKKDTQ